MSITERIDAVTLIAGAARSVTPPAPRSVKIELTGRCNFRCTFCATADNLREKRDMPWGFYADLVPQLLKAGVRELGLFFLGESMLYSSLPQAVAYAKEKGCPYVFLTTNGSLAEPHLVRRLMLNGLDSLKFSLNYADAQQLASVARVKESLFASMLAKIKQAREVRDEVEAKTGHRCGLYASYIRYDGEQGARMQALLEELAPYLDEIYALPLYSQADLVGQAEAARGWAVKAGNPGRADCMREPIPCWSLFTEARVTWDGHLAACCFDHDGRFDMGDLTTTTFREAWHSPAFQDLRRAHLAGDVAGTACERCIAWG